MFHISPDITCTIFYQILVRITKSLGIIKHFITMLQTDFLYIIIKPLPPLAIPLRHKTQYVTNNKLDFGIFPLHFSFLITVYTIKGC